MFRLHLFASTVIAICGIIFWPCGAIVMGLAVWILSSGGVPDKTVWQIMTGVGSTVVAIVGSFVYFSIRKLWLVAPNGLQGARRIASIGLHLLLVVAHCLLAVLIIDRQERQLSNTWGLALILLTLTLYSGGCAVLYLQSQQTKPRRLDW